MFDPALLQAGTAEKLEGFELERIVDLLIDAIFFKEGRLRRCMPLIIAADPGITLPDGDIFGQLIPERRTEKQLINVAGIVQICEAGLDFQVNKKG